MLKSIRIQNLRSFEDTGQIALLPLTIVVGKNSSGKSTLLRTFPLLRQSVETRTTGPLAWFGRFVDFGAFPDAVRRGEESISIDFGFRMSRRIMGRRVQWIESGGGLQFAHGGLHFLSEDPESVVTLHLSRVSERDPSTRTSACEVSFCGHRVRFDFSSKGTTSVSVGGTSVEFNEDLRVIDGGRRILPLILATESGRVVRHGMTFQKELLDATENLFWHRTKSSTRLRVLDKRGVGTTTEMLRDLREESAGGRVFRQKTDELSEDSPVFLQLQRLLLASAAIEILESAGDELGEAARSVKYIAPVRATAQRYYRVSDLAVDEVDFEGGNTALFIKSLSTAQRREFQSWTRSSLGFEVSPRAEGGHVLLKVKMDGAEDEFNIADMGFGISQVLPIAAQVWSAIRVDGLRRSRVRGRLVALEQPELHLHPAMQRRLSRLLATMAAGPGDVRFLIETHSQAMVNEVGRMVEEGVIPREHVQILVVESDDSTSTSTISTAQFADDGTLMNWPHGFFDWRS